MDSGNICKKESLSPASESTAEPGQYLYLSPFRRTRGLAYEPLIQVEMLLHSTLPPLLTRLGMWPENATQLYRFPNIDPVWAENSNWIFDLQSNAFFFSSVEIL